MSFGILNVILPLLSTAVSLVFAATVLSQYASRRKPYQLVWGIGLIWYAASAFTEVLVGVHVWNDLVYRLWYLIGAIFVAAYLGMGTVYLLAPRRIAHAVMVLLVLGSVVAAYLLLTAQFNLPVSAPQPLNGKAIPDNLRLLTPFFNAFGGGALIIGALYSAWVYWRRHIFPQRVVSNVLIAVGAFFPSLGGSLLRFGVLTELFYLCEFLGVALIFAGFLANYEVIASRFAPAKATS